MINQGYCGKVICPKAQRVSSPSSSSHLSFAPFSPFSQISPDDPSLWECSSRESSCFTPRGSYSLESSNFEGYSPMNNVNFPDQPLVLNRSASAPAALRQIHGKAKKEVMRIMAQTNVLLALKDKKDNRGLSEEEEVEEPDEQEDAENPGCQVLDHEIGRVKSLSPPQRPSVPFDIHTYEEIQFSNLSLDEVVCEEEEELILDPLPIRPWSVR